MIKRLLRFCGYIPIDDAVAICHQAVMAAYAIGAGLEKKPHTDCKVINIEEWRR